MPAAAKRSPPKRNGSQVATATRIARYVVPHRTQTAPHAAQASRRSRDVSGRADWDQARARARLNRVAHADTRAHGELLRARWNPRLFVTRQFSPRLSLRAADARKRAVVPASTADERSEGERLPCPVSGRAMSRSSRARGMAAAEGCRARWKRERRFQRPRWSRGRRHRATRRRRRMRRVRGRPSPPRRSRRAHGQRAWEAAPAAILQQEAAR